MDDIEFIHQRLQEKAVSIDAVYSSALHRARETAAIYARLFGVDEVIAAPDLNEVNYGGLQTREKSWVYQHYPEHKKNPCFIYPGGESFQQMRRRCVRFLSSVVESRPQSTVLVVSHAGAIRALVSHFLNLDYAECLSRKIPFRYIGDFGFEQGACVRYDEPGKSSGFAQDGVIAVPFANACRDKPTMHL